MSGVAGREREPPDGGPTRYLELADVGFAYGPRTVLAGVTLAAARGAFVGLVGPNGSGKTTLLRLIQGLLRPTEGTIRLDGVDLLRRTPRERALAVAGLWQRPPLAFDFTVRQIVMMGRTPHLARFHFESARDQEVVERVMRETETLAFADRAVRALSAGETQRVFLAAALAQETPLLLLDEPTTHLDLRQAARLSALLERLRERGITFVCASHDLDLLRRHADSVVLLHDGRPWASGPPAETLRREVLAEVFALAPEDWYLGSSAAAAPVGDPG